MKHIFIIITTVAVIGLGGVMTLTTFPAANADNEAVQAQVGEQTTTFSIEKMTCAACPICLHPGRMTWMLRAMQVYRWERFR